jgi:hypothetical protein
MKIYEQPKLGGPACGLRAPRRFIKPEFVYVSENSSLHES